MAFVFLHSVPLVDVCPRVHHVVVDLGDLVRVIVGVQGQQSVSKRVGFIHLSLPLLELLQKELRRRRKKEKKEE